LKKKKVADPASDTSESSTQETTRSSEQETQVATAQETAKQEVTGNTTDAPKSPEQTSTGSETDQGKAKDANENGRINKVVHTKSISIKDSLAGNIPKVETSQEKATEDIIEEKTSVTEHPGEEIVITSELIVEAWNAYAESIKVDQPRIYNTLVQCQPSLDPSGRIHIVMSSHAQKDNFSLRIKPEIVKYFRENVKNIEYSIESTVKDNGDVQKKVYTDEDKMNFLIKKIGLNLHTMYTSLQLYILKKVLITI